MKNVYSAIAVFFIAVLTLISQSAYSQALCSGVITPNKTSYVVNLATTTANSSTVSFPQFDSTKGKLVGICLEDTLSGITTTTVLNTGSVTTVYSFLLTEVNSVAGPSCSLQTTYTRNYGPTTLATNQSMQYGPDSLFTNAHDSNYTTTTTGYIGKGTVSFVYTLSGGVIAEQGGLNFNAQIQTNYHGIFRLTYYWCSTASIDSNCMNFTATKDTGCVNLKWGATEIGKNCSYEIQCGKSESESSFGTCGHKHSDSISSIINDQPCYTYKYSCNTNQNARLCFRIKCTDAQGNTTYSPIRTVVLNPEGRANCQVYPNPVKNAPLTVSFDENLTGNYEACLMNSSGQCMQKTTINLFNNNVTTINLTCHPKPGMYYLNIRNTSSNSPSGSGVQYSKTICIQ